MNGPLHRLRSTLARWSSRLVALGVLLGIALVVALAGVMGHASSAPAAPGQQPGPIDRVSNSGTPFTALLPTDHRTISALKIAPGEIALLGTNGKRAFYRLGSSCYAAGPAVPLEGYTFGVVKCSTEFPSAAAPVVDFTIVHSAENSETAPAAGTLWRSEGVAADGVSKLAFVSAEGQVLTEAPVVNNTYHFETTPTSARSLKGYDAKGSVVFSNGSR